MNTKKMIVALILVLVSGASLANEPTEREMISAIQNQYNRSYAGASAMKQSGCSRMRESQNPYDAMACLMGGMAENIKISISSFEKIGCAKAKMTGYYCDYKVSFNTPVLGAMGNMGGGITTKRFIETRSGWMITE